MKMCAKSEIPEIIEGKSEQFTPYGFTCEVWTPRVMDKFDRHNEVEINYIPSGDALTYLIHDRIVSVPSGRIVMFWGLYPHRVIDSRDIKNYYVITIPLSVFLRWPLSNFFIDNLLKGEVIIDSNPLDFDRSLFDVWHSNLMGNSDFEDIVISEVQSRIRRLEKLGYNPGGMPVSSNECGIYSYVERMAMYISFNYNKRISVTDVANSVGLHPDYANSIFKKVFCHPISDHIAMERITNAQRSLLFSSENISAIAYDVGYETLSSFNRAFKKLTGLSPRKYRAIT